MKITPSSISLLLGGGTEEAAAWHSEHMPGEGYFCIPFLIAKINILSSQNFTHLFLGVLSALFSNKSADLWEHSTSKNTRASVSEALRQNHGMIN